MRRDWQIMLALAAITVAVFWPVTRHEFINFDDPAYVTRNPVVREGLTWAGVKWAFGELHGEVTYWHPVTWLSHMLDCQLFGVRPLGHHLSSLFLHTLNVLLLFRLLRRMTGRQGPSALVAILFAIHPLQVDSVAWIAERKNLLSGLFFMLTIWAYSKTKAESRKQKAEIPDSESPVLRSSTAEGGRITSTLRSIATEDGHHASRFTFHPSSVAALRRVDVSLFYLLSLSFFALGLMSKPTLVPLPFVLLLLDYWPLRRSAECGVRSAESRDTHQTPRYTGRVRGVRPSTLNSQLSTLPRLLVEKLPFFALSAAASVVTIRAHAELGALVGAEELPMAARLSNAIVAYALYLRKLVWPADLSVFYLHPGQWPAATVAGSALVVVGMSAVAAWQARRRPYLIVGWLWFLGMLVPVIGLVQAHVQAMADRFAYLPAIGVFVMAAGIAKGDKNNHRWTQMNTDGGRGSLRSNASGQWSVIGGQVSPNCELLGTAGHASPVLRSSTAEGGRFTFHRHLCSSVSICGSAFWSYSLAALVLAGFAAMTSLQLRYWRNSVTLLQHAVQVEPSNFIAPVMLGNALFERQQFDGALREYEEATRLRPDYPEGWLRAGVALIELGRPADAMPWLTQAVQLAPDWPEVQRRLGLALLRQGRLQEAKEAYEKLAAMMPDTAEGRRDLADMLAEGEQYGEAIRYYGEALRLKPDFMAALNNLAMLRASCKQPEFRNGSEAVRLAEAACRLSSRRDPNCLGTLAAAYAEAGRFPDAIKAIQEALDAATASGDDGLVQLQTRMLQQFHAGKAFRQLP